MKILISTRLKRVSIVLLSAVMLGGLLPTVAGAERTNVDSSINQKIHKIDKLLNKKKKLSDENFIDDANNIREEIAEYVNSLDNEEYAENLDAVEELADKSYYLYEKE